MPQWFASRNEQTDETELLEAKFGPVQNGEGKLILHSGDILRQLEILRYTG